MIEVEIDLRCIDANHFQRAPEEYCRIEFFRKFVHRQAITEGRRVESVFDTSMFCLAMMARRKDIEERFYAVVLLVQVRPTEIPPNGNS